MRVVSNGTVKQLAKGNFNGGTRGMDLIKFGQNA
jgi:hypothetical protein